MNPRQDCCHRYRKRWVTSLFRQVWFAGWRNCSAPFSDSDVKLNSGIGIADPDGIGINKLQWIKMTKSNRKFGHWSFPWAVLVIER
jgi:hypothetical protein